MQFFDKSFNLRQECKHNCYNKELCSHDCCKEGVIAKTPKRNKIKKSENSSKKTFLSDFFSTIIKRGNNWFLFLCSRKSASRTNDAGERCLSSSGQNASRNSSTNVVHRLEHYYVWRLSQSVVNVTAFIGIDSPQRRLFPKPQRSGKKNNRIHCGWKKSHLKHFNNFHAKNLYVRIELFLARKFKYSKAKYFCHKNSYETFLGDFCPLLCAYFDGFFLR